MAPPVVALFITDEFPGIKCHSAGVTKKVSPQ